MSSVAVIRKAKNEIRKKILDLRDALDQETRRQYSEAIAGRLFELEVWEKAELVFLYLAIRSEVETDLILKEALKKGKSVAVPFTDYNNASLIPSRLQNPVIDLMPRRYGILEPKEEALRPVPASYIDLTIVPGSVFDLRGGRIGYGMGCYDRFLPELPEGSPAVGLGFEIQIVPVAPVDEHDRLMDLVITEKRIINPRARVLTAS